MIFATRLFIVALIGLSIALGYLKWGEPALRAMKPVHARALADNEPATDPVAEPAAGTATVSPELRPLYGEYVARASNGRYSLTLGSAGASMVYTDPANHQYVYRGHYTVDGHALEVIWREQQTENGWKPITPVPDDMTIVSLNAINAPQRAFVRHVAASRQSTKEH
jgi:hypothetical protein